MIVPVILSGGSGTRLWPLSRPEQPKQLLAMVDDRTMVRATFDRLAGIADMADPLVVCNVDHHHLVAAELSAASYDPSRVVLEPVGRNTAPAIAAAAVVLTEEGDDPILLVLPADHVIRDEDAFRAAVAVGATHAGLGKLVTFGIVPDHPETGYGYVRAGETISENVAALAEFVEKPDLPTAEHYVAAGNYRWNSGMFMFRASRYLEELGLRHADMVEAATAAVGLADRQHGVRLDAAAFSASPADSIDFAVMEHTEGGVVVSLEAGWSDVGSWAALWEMTVRDADDNAIVGDVTAIDTRSSYLRSESRLVTAIGLEGMIVVETADAVMIASRDRSQQVKDIVAELKEASRVEAARHLTRTTQFGTVQHLSEGEGFRVVQLVVAPGRRMAARRHDQRAARWVIQQGAGAVSVGDETHTVAAGDTVFIPSGVSHFVDNPNGERLVLVEIQFGSSLADDDIDIADESPGLEPAS